MPCLQFSLQFPAGAIGRPAKRAFRECRPSVIAAEGRRPQNRYEGLNPAARSPPASRRAPVIPPQWRNVRGPLSVGDTHSTFQRRATATVLEARKSVYSAASGEIYPDCWCAGLLFATDPSAAPTEGTSPTWRPQVHR